MKGFPGWSRAGKWYSPAADSVHDNIADLPSRGEFALLQTLGGAGGFRPAVVPSLGSMVGPLMPLLA